MRLCCDGDTFCKTAHKLGAVFEDWCQCQETWVPLPHQQAADQLGGNLLGGAGEEGVREVLGGRGGYGCGFVWKC